MTNHTHTENVFVDGPSGETQLQVEINYSVNPGYRGDRIDPPQAASISIMCWELTGPDGPLDCPKWLADIFTPDNATLLQFAADDLQAEAEDRADARRDINREDAE